MSCPACEERRLHTEAEFAEFHPYAGHGFTRESGWTHADLAVAAETKGEGKA